MHQTRRNNANSENVLDKGRRRRRSPSSDNQSTPLKNCRFRFFPTFSTRNFFNRSDLGFGRAAIFAHWTASYDNKYIAQMHVYINRNEKCYRTSRP